MYMMLLSESNVTLLITSSALMPCPCVKAVKLTIFMPLFQVAVAPSITRSLEVKVGIAGSYGE